MMRILVTGGCGFIGSSFVRIALAEQDDWEIVNVDALTYAGNLANLQEVARHPRYDFVRGDIADAAFMAGLTERIGSIDVIVNFAAESHVDRSVLGPGAFVRTNIEGTFQLLELARRYPTIRYVQISTDEVYGSLGDTGTFSEHTPLRPSSPYSATKAAADHLVHAYHTTYGLDTVITRCSNNYGPYQFPEKLIPLMILNAQAGKPLPVYGDGRNVRDWVHVEDHCHGIVAALTRGAAGGVYNFGGQSERANIDIVNHVVNRLGADPGLIQFVTDRPGHDWRYAMNIDKARRELGWHPSIAFEDGLDKTIEWYQTHRSWWEPITTGEYQTFYDAWYGDR